MNWICHRSVIAYVGLISHMSIFEETNRSYEFEFYIFYTLYTHRTPINDNWIKAIIVNVQLLDPWSLYLQDSRRASLKIDLILERSIIL